MKTALLTATALIALSCMAVAQNQLAATTVTDSNSPGHHTPARILAASFPTPACA